MKKRPFFFIAAIVFSVACGQTQTSVQAALQGMKVKSVSLQGSEREKVANDFVATAVMGELLKRGAVASEEGLEVTGRVEWDVSLSQSSYYGVKVAAAVFDPQGISFSVTAEDNLSPLGPYTYVRLAQNVAVRFGLALDEQVSSQRDRGRTATVKPQPQELPVSDPDKAISRVGIPDTVSPAAAPTRQ